MKKMKLKLLFLFITLVSFLQVGCYTTKVIQTPIYETRKVPYKVKEKRNINLPPIVPGESHIIAFTRFAGGNIPTIEQVQENIKLGFQEQKL